MSHDNQETDQKDDAEAPFSVQLEMTAQLLGLITDALSLWALFEAIDEAKTAEQEEAKAQDSQNEQLQKMQEQIDLLTAELAALKRNRW